VSSVRTQTSRAYVTVVLQWRYSGVTVLRQGAAVVLQ
jgi:hypothetical protein